MFPVTDHLSPAGWTHLGWFGVLLPLLTVLGRTKLVNATGPLPDRLRHFQRTTVSLVALAAVSLAVAYVQRIDLFPRQWPSLWAVMAGLVAYAAAVAYMRPRWRRAVERKAQVVHFFMPANAVERGWWLAVSVLAGIGEEITWRGVQAALVGCLTGYFWTAALACAISFGLAHAMQGWRSVAVIVVFALGFHLLVWLAGSLYVAMAVHVAYDITAGLHYGRLGRELGYLEKAVAAATDPP
jgi:membrane protease YdiL (CAAX protease family)